MSYRTVVRMTIVLITINDPSSDADSFFCSSFYQPDIREVKENFKQSSSVILLKQDSF